MGQTKSSGVVGETTLVEDAGDVVDVATGGCVVEG